MSFFHGSALSKVIRRILHRQRADIAVAFWGDGACERLGIPLNAKGSRVACDARSGACNPSAIADLLNRQVSIVDVPGLHAKVYIGGDGVVISSANASANGLGEEGVAVEIGTEAGYLAKRSDDIALARHWFESIFRAGNPITKDDLPEIRQIWEKRQPSIPRRQPNLNNTWLDWLDVVNCAKFPDDITEGGVYICPSRGGAYHHKVCRFFGMYRNKTVERVAEIRAIVDVDTSNNTQTIFWINPNLSEYESDLKSLALTKHQEWRSYESPMRVFLLGEQFETSFRKDSPGGMRQSKRYMDISSLRIKSAEDLARRLSNINWSSLGYT